MKVFERKYNPLNRPKSPLYTCVNIADNNSVIRKVGLLNEAAHISREITAQYLFETSESLGPLSDRKQIPLVFDAITLRPGLLTSHNINVISLQSLSYCHPPLPSCTILVTLSPNSPVTLSVTP
jgi:hypothetical protein